MYTDMGQQILVTGLRTNAEYHLGNYLGALLPMVTMAREKAGEVQVNLFAPDLHSFTTPIDHAQFYTQTMHNIKLFVAAGFPLDHADAHIYRQSRVPAHSELTWILSNFTGFGEMSRMVEFKDKAAQLKEDRVSVGLFSYPILMASDILLYGAQWVPVGEDQRQHLEFARDIAQRMNNQFGDLFVVPETIQKQQEYVGRDDAPRIRSLRDPSKKMSKSIDDPAGTIIMSDEPAAARKKIMSATTDNVGVVNFDWEQQPGVTNLLQILALLSGRTQEDVNTEWTGASSYGSLKTAVADEVCALLEKVQSTMASIDNAEIEAKLHNSEKLMNETANATLYKVQKAIGLR